MVSLTRRNMALKLKSLITPRRTKIGRFGDLLYIDWVSVSILSRINWVRHLRRGATTERNEGVWEALTTVSTVRRHIYDGTMKRHQRISGMGEQGIGCVLFETGDLNKFSLGQKVRDVRLLPVIRIGFESLVALWVTWTSLPQPHFFPSKTQSKPSTTPYYNAYIAHELCTVHTACYTNFSDWKVV